MNTLLLIPGVEIELRVGSINNKNLSFDSSIDKEYSEKINTSLLSYPEWELVEEIHTTDYVYSVDKNKKIRISVDSLNNKKSIIKENIITKNISLKNSPFDIRFSVNQELNNSSNDLLKSLESNNKEITRQKARRTFKNKNFNYDLTNVIETKNNVKKEKFELEIELNINEETLEWSDEYIKDFLICKLNDLINIIEKTENINFENLQLI
jgi:hypothetical protein